MARPLPRLGKMGRRGANHLPSERRRSARLWAHPSSNSEKTSNSIEFFAFARRKYARQFTDHTLPYNLAAGVRSALWRGLIGHDGRPQGKEDIIVNKYIAELFGTAVLVLMGCGAVVLTGYPTAFPLGMLPIAFAFGLSVMAMAYGIGPISGCHINPAVTLGVWSAGRMPFSEAIGYIISQCIGAIIGAGILYLLVTGKLAGYDVAKAGLGQNGWGDGYLGAYGTGSAMIAEFVGTLIFLVAILGVTQKNGGHPGTAGLAIGLTLVLIHIVFINVTGVSVNPARSLGPALFVGGNALAQLWLFLIVPSVGGIVAGLLFKAKLFEA